MFEKISPVGQAVVKSRCAIRPPRADKCAEARDSRAILFSGPEMKKASSKAGLF
jgi:hypothetical protein